MILALVFFLLGLLHGVLIMATIAAFRRRGALGILLGLVSLAMVLALFAVEAGWFYAANRFDQIERVDTQGSLAGAGSPGTNYLLVGTDSRPGFTQNLADTILVLRLGDGPPRMMSIPRDLQVPIPTRGGAEGRINSSYNDGPVGLIRTVQESVGIPIDRYVEINFTSFAGLIDALGGVTISFPNPAIDVKSGLNVTQSGEVRLDGTQALAYVRSRAYQEVIDGVVQPTDGLADLSRIERQQTFLRAVFSEVSGIRNPLELNRVGTALLGGLRVDDEMELIDALGLAWVIRGSVPTSVELPVAFIPNSGAVALDQPAAGAVIADFAG